MIWLHPETGGPVDPVEAVAAEARPPLPDRPWVLTNMVASADGATAVAGLSGQLGGPADQAVFAALRGVADAIVVGAATVRAERYRVPGLGGDQQQAGRAARGQAPRPRIVVVTASLGLDPELPLFTEPDHRPVIATTAQAPTEARRRLEPVAEVITVGEDRVDLATLLARLGADGHRTVLAEGGPALNGQLVDDDLIDEWNLTVSPLLVAGDAARAAHGPVAGGPPRAMALDRVWLADDLLFCRWLRRPRRA